jgi:hypothetical protein
MQRLVPFQRMVKLHDSIITTGFPGVGYYPTLVSNCVRAETELIPARAATLMKR